MVSPASDFGVTAPNDVRLQKQEFLQASLTEAWNVLSFDERRHAQMTR